MSNRIRSVKTSQYFKKWDLVVYGAILAIIAVCFCVAFIPKKAPLERVEIYYQEKLIYIYEFSDGNGIMLKEGENYVKTAVIQDKTEVEISTSIGYNKLIIDKNGVKMTESDCSLRADCVNVCGKIEKGGQAIFCLPNEIKVIGYGQSDEVIL